MSINLGLIAEENFNCIVGFSGKIIDKENISKRIKSKTKMLLIHGDQDVVVPPNSLLEAKDFCLKLYFCVPMVMKYVQLIQMVFNGLV